MQEFFIHGKNFTLVILNTFSKVTETGRSNFFTGGLKPELIQGVIDVIDDKKFTEAFTNLIELGKTLPDHPSSKKFNRNSISYLTHN